MNLRGAMSRHAADPPTPLVVELLRHQNDECQPDPHPVRTCDNNWPHVGHHQRASKCGVVNWCPGVYAARHEVCDCDACDGDGVVDDPTACGDPDHCAGWMHCPDCPIHHDV